MKRITGTPTLIRVATRTGTLPDGSTQDFTGIVTTVSTSQGFTAHFQVYRTSTQGHRTGYVKGFEYSNETDACLHFENWLTDPCPGH